MSAKSVIEAASCAYRCIFGEEMPETLMEGISADSRCTYCHEYYTGDAREICHAAKEGDLEAIMRMAREMSRYVSPGDILVPVPSHTGRATMTLELAKQIAWNSGARVEDVLIGSSRKSLYELKREGVQVPEGFFGLRLVRPVEGRIWLVDNVVATGSTAREAMKLLPNAHVLAYAMDSGRYLPMTESYTDDIAAVARRIKGGEEPNFTHHGYLLNKWLVHYSPYAETVAQHGFRYARRVEDDMSASLDTDTESGDYLSNIHTDGNIVFAFPMGDLIELDTSFASVYEGNTDETGAVVFIGSGEYVYESGDMEQQVIVDKSTVHGALFVSPDGSVYGAGKRGVMHSLYSPELSGDGYINGFRWIAEHQAEALMHMIPWDGMHVVPSAYPLKNRCLPKDYADRIISDKKIAEIEKEIRDAYNEWSESGKLMGAEYSLDCGIRLRINVSELRNDIDGIGTVDFTGNGPCVEIFVRNAVSNALNAPYTTKTERTMMEELQKHLNGRVVASSLNDRMALSSIIKFDPIFSIAARKAYSHIAERGNPI